MKKKRVERESYSRCGEGGGVPVFFLLRFRGVSFQTVHGVPDGGGHGAEDKLST